MSTARAPLPRAILPRSQRNGATPWSFLRPGGLRRSKRGERQTQTIVSQRKPSPQRLMWPRDGDGKCAKQHSVLVSQ